MSLDFISSSCTSLSLAVDGGKLCPHLEDLSITTGRSYENDPDPEGVVRMLSSRFNSCNVFRATVRVSIREIEMAMRDSDELKEFLKNRRLVIW